MRMINKFLILSVLMMVCFTLFTSCDNLVGLGSRVNTEFPVITTPDGPGAPGGFLSGNNARAEIVVDQPFGMDRVFMVITYTPLGGGADTIRVIEGVAEGNEGLWVFFIDTTDMEDGEIRAQVTAVDVDGKEATTPDIIYRILNTGPQIQITLPAGISEHVDEFSRGVTSTTQIVGSVSIHTTRVYYALGFTEVGNPSLGMTYEDTTGWTEALLHPIVPQPGHQGHQRLGQTFYDILPDRAGWSGSLSTGFVWRFLNIADVVDPAYYVVPFEHPDFVGENLWVLPIKFRLVDPAGNVTITTVRLLVDPDADLPVTTITSHAQGQVVGGPIRVSGTAQDNEVVHTVYMRLHKESDADAIANTVTAPENFVLVHDWEAIAFGHGSPFISWSTPINHLSELDPPDGANRRRVLLEFRTRDAFVFSPNAPKGFGHIESLLIEFDNTVPIIGTPVILQGSPFDIGAGNIETALGDYFDFAGGSSISGFVTMRIVVQAPAGLRHIRLRSGDDNIDLLAASNNPGFNNVEPWLSARRSFQNDGDEYTLFIPINTAVLDSSPDATRFGSGFPLLTFPFPLELQLADNTDPSPFMAQNNYILRIDNRHPLGRYTGSLTAINHLHTIAGQAWDHGPGVTVQGIDRVVVFFSRTDGLFDGFGTPLTSNGTPSNPSAVGWRTDMNVLEDHEGTVAGITQQGTPRVLPFFPTNFDLGGTGIQVNLEGAGAFSGSLGSPPLHNWHISNFDFSNFADGLLYVNYVIIDRAGNATFYREEIFLAVNRPVIRAVELGTTIGLGTTFSARNLPHGPLDPVDSNFRVRNNNFTLRLDVTNPLGVPITGALSYDIAHVTRVSNTPIPASQMEAGRVYRIAYRGTSIGLGAVDWVNYGVLVDLSVPVDGTLINPEGITFVATRNGSPANDGLVYEYEVPAVGPRRQVNTWTPATQINFGSTSFGSAPTLISDSVKVMPPEGAGVNYAFQNDRYFLVRVSNTATTPHITSAALVRVDVHNIDSRPPVLNIADFGYRAVGSIGNTPIQNFADRDILRLGETAAEYNMNIVMAPNGERRGYVQYHWHGDTPRADVSGRIIFRGMAADNNRITGMSVTIGGVTTQLATWGTDGLVREASLGSVQAMGNDGSTDQFGFDVSYQTNTLNFNHVFNWELAWDSSRLTGMVGNNVPIIFTVTDGVQNTPQTINVNVVPYITEISTPLSAAFAVNPSAFNRSARGWYPVRENDLITIRGFNLGGVGATPAVTLAGTNLFMGTSTSTQILANIGETAQSGPLVVTINGIQSLNNRSNNAAHYNREPNNLNNNLLTNARYMYVWQTGFLLNAPVLDNPVMQMRYDGTWNLAYARFHHGPIGTGLGTINAGQVRIMRSLGTAANATAAITDTVVRQGGQRYVHIGLATDGFGDWFVAASNIASPIDGLQNFVIHTREETGILNTAPAQSNFHGLRHRNLIRLTGDPERIRAPSVFAQTPGNGTAQGSIAAASRVLVGYFDTVGNNNALFFRYGLIGGTNAEISATAGFGGNFPNNPSPPNSNDNFDPVTHLFTPFIAGEDAGRPQVVAHSGTTHQGSQHVAVGALGNGLPVIAWFDRVNQTLVFSHGNSAPTTTQLDLATSISVTSTADWQNNARIIHYGAGSHVSMAIDGNNVVHIAYHDAVNGGLMYARIYPTGSGTSLMPDMSRIYVARVDTFLSAGIRLTIDVRRETHGTSTFYVPYISYFHNTFAETRNPIRVAWLRPDSSGGMSIRHGTFGGNLPLGSTANLTPGSIAAAAFPEHSFTGEWEIMTVPAYHVPTAVDFVGIGVPRTGRFFAPTNSGQAPNNVSNLARAGSFATTLTALHRSVLVGYMTLNNFEGAVLKYSIWD